ncbi:hypothetical protein EDD21DRAFT_213648 [Dissophora ornata]|nr:hypothetical protein EDD21DRAFT_213648 [Dissophora ornata]
MAWNITTPASPHAVSRRSTTLSRYVCLLIPAPSTLPMADTPISKSTLSPSPHPPLPQREQRISRVQRLSVGIVLIMAECLSLQPPTRHSQTCGFPSNFFIIFFFPLHTICKCPIANIAHNAGLQHLGGHKHGRPEKALPADPKYQIPVYRDPRAFPHTYFPHTHTSCHVDGGRPGWFPSRLRFSKLGRNLEEGIRCSSVNWPSIRDQYDRQSDPFQEHVRFYDLGLSAAAATTTTAIYAAAATTTTSDTRI